MARPDDDDRDDRDDRDDDRRPRRRRDRDRDRDEDDDRPRRRASGGSGKTIGIIVGIVVGVVVVCGGGMAALLIPAMSKVRNAAARMNEQNNLKQIGLAMHAYSDVNGGFPGPYAVDKGAVKTGLSYRVSLLPYMEQDSAYRRFDLNQPWDNATNRPLAAVVTPPLHASVDPAGTTTTPYRVFFGGGAMFDADGRLVTMASISDGTSNTFMVVRTAEQVPWPKPAELPYTATTPLPPFGNPGDGGSNVLFADGSVKFLSTGASNASIHAGITKAGGEAPIGDW